MSEKSKKNNIVVLLLSILFVVFAALCITLAILGKKSILFVSAAAYILITLTMNIAERFNVNKHNAKTINTISIILDVIAIPFIFIYNVFSLAFSIPAFILSNKSMKQGKNKLPLILCVISIVLMAISLVYSIVSFAKMLF